jgi:hypothetical protein
LKEQLADAVEKSGETVVSRSPGGGKLLGSARCSSGVSILGSLAGHKLETVKNMADQGANFSVSTAK